jgi:hypothetical protein
LQRVEAQPAPDQHGQLTVKHHDGWAASGCGCESHGECFEERDGVAECCVEGVGAAFDLTDEQSALECGEDTDSELVRVDVGRELDVVAHVVQSAFDADS